MINDPQTTELDLGDVEIELCRLPDVVAVRIVVGPDGEPVEVHVLAHTGKHAKQVARDIQSVALTSFGLDLDRRIISVVQLSANGEHAPTAAASSSPAAASESVSPLRTQIAAVESRTAQRRTAIRITLTRDGNEAVGTAEGSSATSARPSLAAAATLNALQQLEVSAQCLDIDATSVGRVGAEEVVTVTLVMFDPPYERHLVGSALLHHQLDDAVARAVLDATNRRISHFTGAGSPLFSA
jgi:hypothetical protein